MTFKFIRYTIYLLVTFMALVSCKKEITYEGLKGDLKGSIRLYANDNPLTDQSGVTVTAEGSSPLIKATTNTNGEFSLQGLGTGIYDIVFTKDNFCTFKLVSFQFIGGNVPTFLGIRNLFKIPDAKVTELKVDTSSFYYSRNARIQWASSNEAHKSYRCYISEKPEVSYTNYQFTESVYGYITPFSYYLSNTALNTLPAEKKLYLILYPCAPSSSFYYMDIQTGKQIYGVNPSQASTVVSFAIPKVRTF